MFVRHIIMADIRFFFFYFPSNIVMMASSLKLSGISPDLSILGAKIGQKKKKGKIALPFMVGYVLLSSYENNKKTYLTCKARRVVTKLEKEKHLS